MAIAYPPPEEPVEPQVETESSAADARADASAEYNSESTAPSIDVPRGESRFNRFMRRLLRWALLVVVLFGAGVIVTYLFLYRPLQARANLAQSNLEQAQRDLSSAQSRLNEAEGQLKSMQTQVEQAAQDVTRAKNRAALQTVRTDLALARLALANKDGPAARTALVQAQNDLAQMLPTLQTADANLAESVTGRLEIILNELNRDPTTAISDMDILSTNLDQVENLLGLKE
ncbi:MAG TPA: hypothetical protein VIO36_17165 [Anaerolineaceae bacterium]